MKFKAYMMCLNFELTRRCNMQCEFCSKGKAQDIDLSKEIIDKTLDEMQGVYISTLRLSGGEPFLKPELINYLLEQIIIRHIYVENVFMFTNGTQRIDSLIPTFSKTLKYLRSIEPEIRNYIDFKNDFYVKNYNGTAHAKIAIVLSDIGHDISKEEINKTIQFYAQIKDADFCITKQTDTYKDMSMLMIEGNALRNFDRIVKTKKSSLNSFRIVNGNYCFCSKLNNSEKNSDFHNLYVLNKSISVSSNGNVFTGCSMSYERIDKSPIFNILDCQNDFIEKILSFCWEHPLNTKAINIRNMYATCEFCKSKNIELEDVNLEVYKQIKTLNILVSMLEKGCRDMHKLLPTLEFHEIDAVATASLVLQLFNENFPLSVIQFFLKSCSEFDEYTINNISAEWCRGFILFMTNKDKERKKNI